MTDETREVPFRDPAGPDQPDPEQTLVPGRACGTCRLCCKVFSIPELKKPVGRWCIHSVPGLGCGNYDNRPQRCREFFCSWRFDPHLGPEWKPDVSRFVMHASEADQALMVTVDPGMPLAWKRQPYYALLKKFSEVFFRISRKVLVSLNGHITVVLPDRDVALGPIVPGEEILIWREGSTYGARLRRDPGSAQATSANPAVRPI